MPRPFTVSTVPLAPVTIAPTATTPSGTSTFHPARPILGMAFKPTRPSAFAPTAAVFMYLRLDPLGEIKAWSADGGQGSAGGVGLGGGGFPRSGGRQS